MPQMGSRVMVLVMLVETHSFDIIPRGGLVTEEALADLGLFHVRDPH